MGIHYESLAQKEDFKFNGKDVGTIRALVPQDLAVVLAKAGGRIKDLFNSVDAIDIGSLNIKDADTLATQLMERAPKFLVHLASALPEMLADIIAVAADAPDDRDSIMAGMPLPMQLAYTTRLAELTFGDAEGFRLFVGNVLALVKTAEVLTNAKSSTTSIEAEKSALAAG